MITVEEFISENINRVGFPWIDEMLEDNKIEAKAIKDLMIEFAKLHVEASLKIASEKAIKDNMVDNCDDHTPYWGSCQSCGRSDNFKRLTTNTDNIENSILNSYPLENIK